MKTNMKRSDLKQIIKEEYQKILSEMETESVSYEVEGDVPTV